MGKSLKPLRPLPNKVAKSTTLSRLKKRLLLMQRRMTSLENERDELKERNNESTVSLAAQKLENAALRKENFVLQRRYHESTMKSNSHKVKLAEIDRNLRNMFMEIELSIPPLAQISNHLCNYKTGVQNVLRLTRSSENEYSAQGHHQSAVNISDDFNRSNEKRMKQRVGPMVRGLLITKPKIMLERINLPQPQDQDQINNSIDISTVEENNQLDPIREENENDEEMRLRHISLRPKRKLGSSWRRKRQELLAKEREQQSKSVPTPRVSYDGDSSDSENTAQPMNMLEPVLRLRDVSRLLQNSSLVKVDASCSGDGSRGGGKMNRQSENESCRHSRGMRTNDDPLEGSSWMFKNVNRCSYERPPQVNRRSSLLKSDSSDEDGEVVEQNATSASLMNTLVGQKSNHTFTVSGRNRSSSPNSLSKSPPVSVSPAAEPDSTNNVEENPCGGSPTLISAHSGDVVMNSPIQNPRLSQVSSFSEPFSSLANSTRLSTSRRSSQKTGSLTGSGNVLAPHSPREVEGKRVRKPKSHLYPGEEENVKSKSTKPPRTSCGRKSSAVKNKPVKKSTGSKKSKVSLVTPRNSENSTFHSGTDSEDSRPRRNKKTVSYKEPSLTLKQRRP